MHIIRLIENEKDQKQYSALAAYCFHDETGWSQLLFPLNSNDKAMGIFDGDKLASATISKGFTSRIFGQTVPSAGISCVVSSPQYRNKGYINQLLSHVIKTDYSEGKLFSALYPFRFQFYEKFGYGSLGAANQYIFRPTDIREPRRSEGQFVSFDGTETQLNDLFSINNKWVKSYDFGIISEAPSVQIFNKMIEKDKHHIFLHYGKKRNCDGCIRFKFNTVKPFYIQLIIVKYAWENPKIFKALLYFLWTHRDQCKEIEWTTPANIPLSWVMDDQRITHKIIYNWMARPLHVKQLIEMKISKQPLQERLIFSIQDEIISENSGTYIIDGISVKKESFSNKNTIPLHVFSSLLFGGISLKEATLAGLIDINVSDAAAALFSLNRNIFISEFF